jgi:phosphoenolpyruvate---glycerone phosphotransferase subunit DhaL
MPEASSVDLVTVETIDLYDAVAYLRHVASLAHCYHGLLTRLDTVLGDGDHGDNLVAGFDAVQALLHEASRESMGEFLSSVGRILASSLGGASGSLYGSAFMAAGLAVGDAPVIRGADLGRILDAGASAIARRGHCEVGDKTMYDTLRPAADAFVRSIGQGTSTLDAARTAVLAGRSGMASTRRMIARRGLALRLGPRSVGHVDPGAVSAFLLLAALMPPGTRTGLRRLPPVIGSDAGQATGDGSAAGGSAGGGRPQPGGGLAAGGAR